MVENDYDNLPVSSNYPEINPASFRDLSGLVFRHNGSIYRQINDNYSNEYSMLINSGLYQELVDCSYLIPHAEVNDILLEHTNAWKIIKPTEIIFISYPYEWCFSQLKDAALLTLDIQLIALKYGMSLKDASSYNVQYYKGAPIFIDTLSFEKYREGKPWVAYKQFCKHFFAPLFLMSKLDIRLNKLLQLFIDGVSLDLASKLLPASTWLTLGSLLHVHLHAKSEKIYSNTDNNTKDSLSKKLSKKGLIGIIYNLKQSIEKLSWDAQGTEWATYYKDMSYSDKAFANKKQIIHQYLKEIKPSIVWDLGSNNGIFSRIATSLNVSTISFDIDPAAVEINYLNSKIDHEELILPIVLDLSSPSPGLGWCNVERDSFMQRGPTDCAMALALIHHMLITHNVPLNKLAIFFQKICNKLIIEFVPKDDEQTQRLLRSRVDIFNNYSEDNFVKEFSKYFSIMDSKRISGTNRCIYLMVKKQINKRKVY